MCLSRQGWKVLVNIARVSYVLAQFEKIKGGEVIKAYRKLPK